MNTPVKEVDFSYIEGRTFIKQLHISKKSIMSYSSDFADTQEAFKKDQISIYVCDKADKCIL